MYVAFIKDNLVTSVLVSSEESAPEGVVVVGEHNTVGIGWEYIDGKFIPPKEEEDGMET